jgi:hypothetical protein
MIFFFIVLVIVLLFFIDLYQTQINIVNSFYDIVIKKPPNCKILSNDKIFVSIASYRDPDLLNTIDSIIKNSDFPSLLRIVVYNQSDTPIFYTSNIVEIHNDHYSFARGPVWARYVIQQFYNQEQYYLQIDSHTRLIKHWDSILKNMLNLLPDKSVITQYLPEFTNDPDHSKFVRSGLYIQGFGYPDGMTRIQSDFVPKNYYQMYPYTSKAWAACFSFSYADIIADAPYDPYLPFLFFGEELDITLRLFTRGWYFFSPNITIGFTKFDRSGRRTFWQDFNEITRSLFEHSSRKRLCKRLGIPFFFKNPFYNIKNKTPPDLFALGTKRSLKDYEKFADIQSFAELKLSPAAKSFRRHTSRFVFY